MTAEQQRFSFRLPRPLWILLATLLLIVIWLGWRFGLPIYRKQIALKEIELVGGNVQFRPGGPDWLRRWVGDEQMKIFEEVEWVSIADGNATDASLQCIRYLTSVKELYLGEQITDAGLVHLSKMTSLSVLFLKRAQVTGTGFTHLKGLTNFVDLDLYECSLVTDSDLARIGELKQLTNLGFVDCAQVTDAGLENLMKLTNLESLNLAKCDQITDRGVVHLAGLTRLQRLGLSDTGISDAGLKSLERLVGLKDLDLSHTGITDAGLRHLEGLANLRGLNLINTRVSDAGVERLKRKFPKLNLSW